MHLDPRSVTAEGRGGSSRPAAKLGLYQFLRPLAVGLVHGLAGSAAVALLVLAEIRDPRWAIAYLLVFGVGTIAGMMLITMMIGAPFAYTRKRFAPFNQRAGSSVRPAQPCLRSLYHLPDRDRGRSLRSAILTGLRTRDCRLHAVSNAPILSVKTLLASLLSIRSLAMPAKKKYEVAPWSLGGENLLCNAGAGKGAGRHRTACAQPGGLTKSEISRELKRTVSEIFRMLLCLERRGYIAQVESERYALTLKLFQAGAGASADRTAHHRSASRDASACAGDAAVLPHGHY